jgi:hypothetical protein
MPVEPSQPCGRQKEQKGIFLCSNATHWEYDFETCLKNVLQSGIERKERRLYKITVMPDLRDDVLTELKRKGMSHESLFPGLDGLGRSLAMDVSIRSEYFGHYYRNHPSTSISSSDITEPCATSSQPGSPSAG